MTPASGGGRDFRALRSLAPYMWPAGHWSLRARVLLAVGFLVGAKVATVYVPILFGQAVDVLSAEEGAAVALPLGLLLAYGIVRGLSQSLGHLRDAVFAVVAKRAIRTIAVETFSHLHRLSLRFHLSRQTGGLSRAIERGTRGIEFLLTLILFNIMPTLLEIVMVAGILWGMFDVWYALVTLATVGGYIGYTLFITEWRMHYRRDMNTKDSQANTRAIDSLLNYETVKYFCNERHEITRYDSAMAQFERAAIQTRTSLAVLNVGQALIIAAGLTVMVIMAGRGVESGALTVGDFVMVNTYLIQLFVPLNSLGFVYRNIRQSLTDMEQMFELMREPVEVVDRPDAPALAVTAGEIRFQGVDFGYDPRRPILNGLDFTVPPGHRVALVGPSGAGKSTIARLLFRFYDVDRGAITIDGQDLRAVSQDSLRAAIGIVPQDTVLFNDTLFYNIAYGRPGASPDEVAAAARAAAIHDFITGLPDGYDTLVGERGLKLSGGERQRVAIARTILKQPALLIFDEATSALDSHTEQEIQVSLRRLSTDRTTLMIAHRLSTIVDADRILVLDRGRLVEQGTHGELLARGGLYATMWARQIAGDEDHDPEMDS